MIDEDLVAILRDACRLCGADAAQLAMAEAVVACWPQAGQHGLVEIARTPFDTPSRAPASIRLFARHERPLSEIQAMVLAAYAEHASLTLR